MNGIVGLDSEQQVLLNLRTLKRTEGLLDRHFQVVEGQLARRRYELRHTAFESVRNPAGNLV